MVTDRSSHSDDSFGEWSINPYTPDDQPSADTPVNAWSAVDGVQREQPESHRLVPYIPGPQAGPVAASRNDNRGLTITVIVLALIAVAPLVGAMAYFYLSDSKGTDSVDSDLSQSVQSASAEDSSTSSIAKQKHCAEGFQSSSDWRHCSGSGDPGDLNLVYAEDVGGSMTICQFATNVHNFFVEQYQLTEKPNGAVTASSPTTDKIYTMICRDNGEVVTCTGGTNTTVHIV